MTRLLTYNYFTIGRLRISGLSDSDSNLASTTDAIKADLESVIDETEKEVLIEFLGDDLYDAFIDGLGETVVAARWTALKNQLVDSTNCQSPLAAFVFQKWMQYKSTMNTQNSQTAKVDYTPNEQLVSNLWNIAIDDMEDVYDWLVDNSSTYPEWEGGSFTLKKMNIYGI